MESGSSIFMEATRPAIINGVVQMVRQPAGNVGGGTIFIILPLTGVYMFLWNLFRPENRHGAEALLDFPQVDAKSLEPLGSCAPLISCGEVRRHCRPAGGISAADERLAAVLAGRLRPLNCDGPVQHAWKTRQRRPSTSCSLCSQCTALMYSSTWHSWSSLHQQERKSYAASSALALSGVIGSSFAQKALRNASSASSQVYCSPIGNGLPHPVGRPKYLVLAGCRLPLSLLRCILLTIVQSCCRRVLQESEAPARSSRISLTARSTSAAWSFAARLTSLDTAWCGTSGHSEGCTSASRSTASVSGSSHSRYISGGSITGIL